MLKSRVRFPISALNIPAESTRCRRNAVNVEWGRFESYSGSQHNEPNGLGYRLLLVRIQSSLFEDWFIPNQQLVHCVTNILKYRALRSNLRYCAWSSLGEPPSHKGREVGSIPTWRTTCGYDVMVACHLAMVKARVRFPVPAQRGICFENRK